MKSIFKYIVIVLCVMFAKSAFSAVPVKDWTFLIFINGNNDLYKASKQNIKAMEKVGSNDQVNIVVEWADKKMDKAVRMLIQKSNNPTKVTSPVLQNISNADMGDYEVLKRFIAWGVKRFPARHYFIEVWDHGAGWHGAEPPFMNTNISWDDYTHHQISTEELGWVMKYAAKLIGHKVDIYGSDACLMAMAEVADEMTHSVSYFIGSEEVEPDSGWPYTEFLKKWQAIPHANAKQISTILVDEYVESQTKAGEKGVTLSAYDLNKFSVLSRAMNELAENIYGLDAEGKKAVLDAMKKTDRFADIDYGDLLDFMDKLHQANVPGLNPAYISAVQTAAHHIIIANKSVHSVNATGMSIWLPTQYSLYQYFSEHYRQLQFEKDTGWDEVLRDVLVDYGA